MKGTESPAHSPDCQVHQCQPPWRCTCGAIPPPSPPDARPTRFIWTQKALEMWAEGKSDPAHTISAPNIAEVFDGFVRQLRAGTPWALVDADDSIIHTGTAGMKEYV